jgi:hypothetical protein
VNSQRGALQGGAGASVDFDESSDAMVTVLMAQVSSLMREKKALVAEINTLARDNQVLRSRCCCACCAVAFPRRCDGRRPAPLACLLSL